MAKKRLTRKQKKRILAKRKSQRCSPRPKLDKVILVFAMSRSGHNAITSWIAAQHRDNVSFYDIYGANNVVRKVTVISGRRKIHREYRRGSDLTTAIYHLESTWFGRLEAIKAKVPDVKSKRRLIINRDCYNWIASLVKQSYFSESHISDRHICVWANLERPSLISTWCEYVSESISPAYDWGDYELMDVNYNAWTKDLEYRKILCEKMSMQFTDADHNKVSTVAGGSSFDGLSMEYNASAMDVHNRWRLMLDDEMYRRIVKEAPSEMFELNEAYFGMKMPEEIRAIREGG